MSLTNGTYYGPVDETGMDIFLEKTFMASGYLTGFGYGVQLVVYILCCRALWNRQPRTSSTYFLLAYIFVLNAMNTIWTGTSAYGLQLTYIDNRNYPGGPLGFLAVEFSLTPNVLSLASYIIGNVLADAFLLWRCYVIWKGAVGSKAWLVVGIPVLMLLGSISLACLFAWETASPAGFFSAITTSFALPYFALSLSLNLVLTSMIVLQMLRQQYMHRDVLSSEYAQHYVSVATIFVESATLYSVFSILLLATYATGHPINQIWLGLNPSVQMVSTYLIIYRLVKGRAWTTDTWNPDAMHTMGFTSESESYGQSDMRLRSKDEESAQAAGVSTLTKAQRKSEGDQTSWKSSKEGA